MAKLTTSDAETVHLVKLVDNMPIAAIMRLTLFDGTEVEGVVTGARHHSQVDVNGVPRVGGEVTLLELDGTKQTIDLLEAVGPPTDVSDERWSAYEEAGLVNALPPEDSEQPSD